MRLIKIICLGILISFNSLVHAQLTKQWQRNFGFTSADISYPFKAIPDNRGNIYCSVLIYTNISSEACDTLWIIKYDPSGTLLWSTPLKKDAGTVCTDFKMDNDSNLVILASNFMTTTSLSKDFNVIKMDTSGSILWNKNFNDSLIYSKSNLLSFIPGSTEMIITNWARQGTAANVVYVRRLDSNGNQIWKYADTLRFEPGPQWIDNAGYFHFTSEEKVNLQQSYMHYKKMDLNGNAVDSFAFNYQFATRCSNEKNMYVDQSGNIYLNISVQATMLNISHQVVLKLDQNADSVLSFEDVNLIPKFMSHNTITNKFFMGDVEGTNLTQLRSLVAILDDCIFIDSTRFSLNTKLTDQIMNNNGELYTLNYFEKICKFDTSGNLLWQFPTPAFVNTLDQDRFNYKIVKNNYSGDLYYLFADRLATGDPHGVFQIIKYTENPVAVNLNAPKNNNIRFTVTPNPNHGKFKIALKNPAASTTVKIFNSLGENVSSFCFKENEKDIYIPGLNSGIYFISVENSEGRSTQKMIIQN